MSRKLASIRRVKELRPIEGADLIELAIVDGWQCVVKKGEFRQGDLGVYFEIDSFLPIREEFEFLRKSCFRKMGDEEGFRLRTIKLRGQLSQGLIIPMKSLQTFMDHDTWISLDEGDEVTEVIGVKKYDPPIPAQLAGSMAGNFPTFIRKTDQERIQNLYDSHTREFTDNNDVIAEQLREADAEQHAQRITELLENRTPNLVRELAFEVSLKLDGTSTTYFVCDPTKYQTKKLREMEQSELPDVYFGVCGRNFEIQRKEENTYWLVAIRDEIEEKMKEFYEKTGRSIAIQGELMGPKIQGNREGLKDFKFFLFDVWDINEQRHLTPEERKFVVEFLDVDMVPILHEEFEVFKELKSLDEILQFAEGKSITHDIREGLVFKSLGLMNGYPITFKAISNKFLLKGGD